VADVVELQSPDKLPGRPIISPWPGGNTRPPPFDAGRNEPEKRARWRIDEGPVRDHRSPVRAGVERALYQSHFISCPDAPVRGRKTEAQQR